MLQLHGAEYTPIYVEMVCMCHIVQAKNKTADCFLRFATENKACLPVFALLFLSLRGVYIFHDEVFCLALCRIESRFSAEYGEEVRIDTGVTAVNS